MCKDAKGKVCNAEMPKLSAAEVETLGSENTRIKDMLINMGFEMP